MALKVEPLHPHLGAEVRGVDLARPVAADVFAEILAAFNRHAVLVFPGQQITDQQQIAFSALFGPLEKVQSYTGGRPKRLQGDISDLSNLTPDGSSVWQEDDPKRVFNVANRLWHTDSSFKHVPALCSLLSAREVPPMGGETEFADLRAAWDALPDSRKDGLEGLIVEHSILRSRSLIGHTDLGPELRRQLPPVQQVLVRRHPGSGRKTLYLASHASHVVGWPVDKGRKLIEELIAFSVQPRFVYRHHWRVGDLIVWDNRCTMHRGLPFDDLKHRRVMHRTTVSEPANTVEQAQGASLANAVRS
ncbi:MAG TPA: TauD/TfdA family dioxygenase [Gammaproteobacteria bacterium]|nr:TauD/TfdA family dioxygenase [Gammaproteobacteria bacterium]